MPKTHTTDDRTSDGDSPRNGAHDEPHDEPHRHNRPSHFRQRPSQHRTSLLHFRRALSRLRPRLATLLKDTLDGLLRSPFGTALRRRFKTNTGGPTEPAATAPHLDLGRRGELLAAERLRREGYLPVAANFKLNVGRNRRGALVQAEIDLVAYDGPVLCFVEVKTRASDRFAAPEANVDLRKQRQITRAARAYRRLLGLTHAPYRYDVVSVLLPPPGPDGGPAPPPRIRLLRNFWDDDKFRKRRWRDPAADY